MRKNNGIRQGKPLLGVDDLISNLNDVDEVNLFSIISNGNTIIVFFDKEYRNIVGYAGYI